MDTRSAGDRHGRPWRAAGVLLVALLTLGGTAMLTAGLKPAPAQPPQPVDVVTGDEPAPTGEPAVGGESAADAEPEAAPGSAAGPDWASGWSETGPPPTPGATPPSTGPAAPSPAAPAPLPRSEPVKITIPKIKVNAKIMSVGLHADGTVEVPSLKQAHLAGWYRLGVSPGEIGNAVVVGHVDSAAMGPAVFFRLGALKKADQVQVTRTDGSVVRFAVDTVKSYPKTAFPAELVYGSSDSARLQVVTCGGVFDKKKGSYPNNIVVSATRIP
ncbi:class F sortase [Plantactinospora sonchi]|uniref:Class F sortase n=1 Tax=Plantactinospora sonchi TaxID=1544735 RepID=A0ABU7RLD2_9ACTN